MNEKYCPEKVGYVIPSRRGVKEEYRIYGHLQNY
jgi:hypothetical protein